jgi:hypothetical protein
MQPQKLQRRLAVRVPAALPLPLKLPHRMILGQLRQLEAVGLQEQLTISHLFKE